MLRWFDKVYDESGDGKEYDQYLMIKIKTNYTEHPDEYIFIRNFLLIYGCPFNSLGIMRFL